VGKALLDCDGKVMAETRKLAAILAFYVVGYSLLTGADEDRTLARLRALRSDLIDPTTAVHYGRVFKRTGDGALVEFRSVVDAVRCASASRAQSTPRSKADSKRRSRTLARSRSRISLGRSVCTGSVVTAMQVLTPSWPW
jgi:class 3 adenylate cyclase